MVSLDGVFSSLGDRFQILTYVLYGLSVPMDSWLGLLPVFIFTVSDFRCSLPGWENDTYAVQSEAHERLINVSIPQGSKCSIYTDGDNETASCSSWVYDQTVFTPSAAMEFNFVCDRVFLRSTANMMYMLGMLIGSPFSGELSDRFGRRVGLLVGLFIQFVGGIAPGILPDMYSMMVGRVLCGAGAVIAYGAAFVLFTELVSPSKRQAVGIVVNFFYGFGSVSLTLFAYLIRNWRHLTLVLSSIYVLCIGYWWIIPESPRWLMSKRRDEDAKKILRKIARFNKKDLPENVLDELEVGDKVEVEQESVWKLMKNKTCFIRLVIVAFNWVAISTAFYGLALNAGNLFGDLFINFFVTSLVEIPAYVFALLAPYKFGRKYSHMFCMILGGVSCVVSLFVVIYGNESTSWITTALSTIGRFGASAGFASVYIYTAEIFPTSLRNRTIGICSLCARIGNLVAPYVTDLGALIPGTFSSALPLVVFGALSITSGILCIFLPETYERPLPQTLADAEAMSRKGTKVSKEGMPNGTNKLPPVPEDSGQNEVGIPLIEVSKETEIIA